jgi:hypothetical protein
MPSQVDVFRRLFFNELPTSACLRDRARDLFSRESFDDDCLEFHQAFYENGLDFVFCWASVKAGGDGSLTKRIYTEVIERTGADHLYDVGDDVGDEFEMESFVATPRRAE